MLSKSIRLTREDVIGLNEIINNDQESKKGKVKRYITFLKMQLQISLTGLK